MFEISIDRTFAAAHAIRLLDGSLEPVHGHNWQVTVTLSRPELDEMETVADFHVLEAALDLVLTPMHNRHLNEVAPFADKQGGLKISPTAERVAWVIAQALMPNLPPGTTLASVRVTEAAGCVATYRP
jgi:6-pyruvoyltetrahydropterin/6-carboxytetrahydropterin synthase